MGIYESVIDIFPGNNEMRRSLQNAGCHSAWPYKCCGYFTGDKEKYGDSEDLAKAREVIFGRTTMIQDVFADEATKIQNMFAELLATYTPNTHKEKADKMIRLGLPLHYRLWRDKETSSVADNAMQASGATKENWANSGCHIVKEWMIKCNTEIDLAEAYWIWLGVINRRFLAQPYPVATKVVAVDQNKPIGSTGTLSVSLIDWKQHSSFGVKPPESGFVRSPMSFAYYLDKDFSDSFLHAKNYLTEQEIWPCSNWVVEWDIQLGASGASVGAPTLTGGSAGAAIALATGALLARQHKRATSEVT